MKLGFRAFLLRHLGDASITLDNDIILISYKIEPTYHPEPEKGRGGKSWMYTLNNYTPEDVVRHKGFDCTYHVFAEEVGEEGTPHLQGCITFTKNCRFASVAKFMPRCRLQRPEVIEIARNYCMKEDNFILDNRRPGERRIFIP